MRHPRIFKAGVAAVLVLLLSACAPMTITGGADVDKTAFGAKKRFAVVSIASMKDFYGEKGLTQMFKSTDEIPGANTQPLIDNLAPQIVSTLDKSGNFVLVPEQKVLSSKAYRNVTEDEKVAKVLFMTKDLNVAHNYKYISDPQKYAALARALDVDGVIGITMNFSLTAGKNHINVAGLSLGKKKYSVMAASTAMAYDREGNVIWKDSTVKMAEPGDSKAIILIDTTDLTATNFEKLHPSAITIGGKAVEVLLTRFDDTIAGNKVSGIQFMK
ncbi:MAG: hypothetical protein WBO37_07500 [Gammaproteobacteria bacterium]